MTTRAQVKVMTLDELLEMLASDDGMPVVRDGKCDDPDCPFCNPKIDPKRES